MNLKMVERSFVQSKTPMLRGNPRSSDRVALWLLRRWLFGYLAMESWGDRAERSSHDV